MTLHFAYGSNMSRPLMEMRCPSAAVLGTGSLAGWRFVINPDGVGSIQRQSGAQVRGVLWRVSARDLAAINAYEGIDAGLYARCILPVRHHGAARPALVYIARRRGKGIPRPGYINLVVESARS
jgi:cation transport regulator ChaC